MSKYFLYARKSSEAEDRQILSIESQIGELKRIAENQNIQIAEILTEARSAKEPGRPVFNSMMQRIYRGEAKGVLCWKLDRLARNPVDGGSIIWAIKQHGIKITTPTQTYSHDDENIILMYIEFGMAQKYIDDLSRNVKRGIKAKLEKGWYPSVAPLGYLNNPVKNKGEKDIIPDPERFKLVRNMWDLMISGRYSPPKIVEIANKEWGFKTRPMKRLGSKPLNRSAIYKIFTNPFYYGYFEYPRGSGLWFQGSHEPMVNEREYELVQALLGRKGLAKPKKLTFPFTGMMRCGECSAVITAEEKHQLICSTCKHKFAYRNKERCLKCETLISKMTRPKFLHYTYYHCAKTKKPGCSQGSIRDEELEKQIDTYISRIELSADIKQWTIELLQKAHKEEVKGRGAIVQSQQKTYKDCLKRLDNLILLKTSPQNANGNLLSDEEYSQQRVQLLKEKTRLEELFKDTGHRIDKWLELSEKTFEFACYVRDWFNQGNINDKREILSAIGSNLILMDKKVLIQAKRPFQIFENSLPGISLPKQPFEPENNGLDKTKTEAYASACLSGRGGIEDVRTFDDLPPDQKARIQDLVRQVWEFFKETENPPHIPNFNRGKDKDSKQESLDIAI
ncbi:recombinase family protein [bacterium]|nr:recombinase family protein [bacterium]